MRIKVLANLSGVVTASKGQEMVVTAEQGNDLIERRLAIEISAQQKAKPAARNRARNKPAAKNDEPGN